MRGRGARLGSNVQGAPAEQRERVRGQARGRARGLVRRRRLPGHHAHARRRHAARAHPPPARARPNWYTPTLYWGWVGQPPCAGPPDFMVSQAEHHSAFSTSTSAMCGSPVVQARGWNACLHSCFTAVCLLPENITLPPANS